MAWTIDSIAKRYGKLPSEVVKQGTTFDMAVLDMVQSYESFKEGGTHNIPQTELERIMAQVKG